MKWSDVDFAGARSGWRADADKLGEEHWTPLTDAALAALKRAREVNPAVGDTLLDPDVTVLVVAASNRVRYRDPYELLTEWDEETTGAVALLIGYRGFNYFMGSDLEEEVERRLGGMHVYQTNRSRRGHPRGGNVSDPTYILDLDPDGSDGAIVVTVRDSAGQYEVLNTRTGQAHALFPSSGRRTCEGRCAWSRRLTLRARIQVPVRDSRTGFRGIGVCERPA